MTIQIEDQYTLAAGDSLKFVNEEAFNLTGTGDPSLAILGAVTVKSTSVGQDFLGIHSDGDVDGGEVTIGKHGSLVMTGKNGGGVQAGEFGSDVIFTNQGLIDIRGDGSQGLDFIFNGAFTNTGTVHIDGGAGMASGITGGMDVHNSGLIEVSGASAIGVSSNSGLVENSGSIIVRGGPEGSSGGVGAWGGFRNTGDILLVTDSSDSVVVGIQAFEGRFFNSGTIVGKGGSTIAVGIGAADEGRHVFVNHGLISGKTAFDSNATAGDIVLNNTGEIHGLVDLGVGGENTVHNSGLIDGDVLLGYDRSVYITTGEGSTTGTIYGEGGNDRIVGGVGDEHIVGGDGFSNNDRDTLTGGGGADTLTGGFGRDYFIYNDLSDTLASSADLITDLDKADIVDLSGIDADATQAGDQAFHLVSALSGHAGEIALVDDSAHGQTLLEMDVDGDGVADGVIQFKGHVSEVHGLVL